jgi:hypothetical protein
MGRGGRCPAVAAGLVLIHQLGLNAAVLQPAAGRRAHSAAGSLEVRHPCRAVPSRRPAVFALREMCGVCSFTKRMDRSRWQGWRWRQSQARS